MSDGELGALIDQLSEDTGEFPSDNFISNETSYLHVAKTLTDDGLAGRVYIGVGPEQNLTYIALMQPAMAFIIDIRRQNMLQHLSFRAMLEEATTREDFLRNLTARPRPEGTKALPPSAEIEDIIDAVDRSESSPEKLEQNIKTTLSLMNRLGLKIHEGDPESVSRIHRAFASKGLDMTYSMEGSRRRYPTLRELLLARDPNGQQLNFASNPELYTRLRSLILANRVIPVVGDFLGDHALREVAKLANRRSLMLGVFYTSNVEQYLFPQDRYAQFINNVEHFAIDRQSLFLRVWFDQGRQHPRQRRGHRTTTLIAPVAPFLERWRRRPLRSYWEVTTARLPRP